jgi:hypothetical protein
VLDGPCSYSSSTLRPPPRPETRFCAIRSIIDRANQERHGDQSRQPDHEFFKQLPPPFRIFARQSGAAIDSSHRVDVDRELKFMNLDSREAPE